MNNRESSESCVRCGSCKALCPTYREDVSEGMSARGRVVLLNRLNSHEIEPSETLNERIFSCLLCGACNNLCPLGINVTGSIYEGRKKLYEFSKKRKIFGYALKLVLKRAQSGFLILKFLETVRGILPVSKMQPFKMLKELDLALPDDSLRDGMSIFKVRRPKGRIAVFAGCSVNFLYPDMGRALIKSLNAMHYDVILPKGEACCGAPLLGIGLEKDAAELAEKNIRIFKRLNVEAVIGLCPTCVHFIRNEYKKLTGDCIDKAMDVPQFLSSELGVRSLELIDSKLKTQNSKLRVVYHDPCHSIYGLNMSAEPRRILKSMGLSLIEAEKGCCGFGGTFRLLYQELSEAILARRIEEYRRADMIVTSCPNCILQLRSKIKDRPVRHIIELIYEGVRGDRK